MFQNHMILDCMTINKPYRGISDGGAISRAAIDKVLAWLAPTGHSPYHYKSLFSGAL
jgi:hypothetical protein